MVLLGIDRASLLRTPPLMPNAQSDTCICYIGNRGYLFQTLVSALQARSHCSDAYDILLFDLSDDQGEENAAIKAVCEANQIRYIWESPRFLSGLHIMNARMFLDQLLPSDYKQILYLDGDTQVVDEIDPLLEHTPKPGYLCAARDPMIYLDRVGRLKSPFREEIAPYGDGYVNSGMLRVDRTTWADISKEALTTLRRGGPDLHFEDQSLINEVTNGRREFASLRWNFPGFIIGYGLETIAPPAVVHFMSNPRPWQGAYAPWGRGWHQPYLEVVRRFPSLEAYRRRLGLQQFAAYKVKQIGKAFVESRVWKNPLIREEVNRLERDILV